MTEKPLSSTTGKNTFRVDRQVVLPFRKSVEIAFQSIRVRFFRSLITTMSLVLAVSFLSFASVNTDAANGLLQSGDPAQRQALIRAGHDLAETDQTVGSSPKQRWIVMLSLVVCVVGIVNAQLMAVTERFREIGTMKCLGALDRFIVRLFLLEAFMQGAVGAAAGAVIGALFALGNGMFRFGTLAVTAISWSDVALSVMIAVGTGCLLSVGGALYPALLAARMQPVDAMRAEH
jgi:predicted lysophospholipase L1 biosynthesis ABC-type transport system permease subunit